VFPNADTTLVGRDTTDTLSNKSLVDLTTFVIDDADATKRLTFSTGGNATNTTLTLSSAVTSNKTLNFPDISDTLISKNTTDILTNKTLHTNTAVSADISYTTHNAFNFASPTHKPANIYGVVLDGNSLLISGNAHVAGSTLAGPSQTRIIDSRLALTGAQTTYDTTKCSLEMYTAQTQYPVFSVRAGEHDMCTMSFDSYQNSAAQWKSSSMSSNFLQQKFNSELQFYATSNVTPGSDITNWQKALAIKRNAVTGIRALISEACDVYTTGTCSQSGVVVTGVATTFTYAMGGGIIAFLNGSYANIITVDSTTSLTVDISQTVSGQSYTIYYNGFTASREYVQADSLRVGRGGDLVMASAGYNMRIILQEDLTANRLLYLKNDTLNPTYDTFITTEQRATATATATGASNREFSVTCIKQNSIVHVTIRDLSGAATNTVATNTITLANIIPSGFRPASLYYQAGGLIFWNGAGLTMGWSVDTSGTLLGWFVNSSGQWVHMTSGNAISVAHCTLTYNLTE
jgi:hypothetical protein